LKILSDPQNPDTGARLKVAKSAAAFRTISEVSRELGIPQHVLRFWESKFSQVSPLKRGGGRRYYRPEDIRLLERISYFLYVDGFTIKGVQRIIRERGLKVILADNMETASAVKTEKPSSGDGKQTSGASSIESRAITTAIGELLEIQKLLFTTST
jgi:DNA-binding transcriptional MerR regulator